MICFWNVTLSIRKPTTIFWVSPFLLGKVTFLFGRLKNTHFADENWRTFFFLHRRWSSWWAETLSIRWCFLNLWVSERRGWRACVGRKGFLSLRLMVGRRCRSLALASLFPDFSSHRRSYTGDAFLFSVEPRRVCLWSKTNQINHSTTTNNTIWGGSVLTGEEPPPHSGSWSMLSSKQAPNPIPAIPPCVVRTPHLHGAPTTEETVKLWY